MIWYDDSYNDWIDESYKYWYEGCNDDCDDDDDDWESEWAAYDDWYKQWLQSFGSAVKAWARQDKMPCLCFIFITYYFTMFYNLSNHYVL